MGLHHYRNQEQAQRELAGKAGVNPAALLL